MTVEINKGKIVCSGGFEDAVNKFATRQQSLTDKELQLLQEIMQEGANDHIRSGGISDGKRKEKPLLSRS